MMKKLYVIETMKWGSDIAGVLIDAENRETLYSHMSSSADWLRHDLSVGFGRKDELKEKYGEYEVVYVAGDDPLPDELKELFS